MNWLHPRRRPRRPPRRPTRILLLLGSICIQALRPTRAKVRRGSLIVELCNPPDLEPNRELMRVRFKNEGGGGLTLTRRIHTRKSSALL